MSDIQDLGLIIDSRVPIVVLESYEEPRALELLTRVAITRRLPLFCWSITEGVKRLGFGSDVSASEDDGAENVLLEIKSNPDPAIYVLCDFHPYMTDAKNIRLLKDIALEYSKAQHTVVLLSHAITIPPDLSRMTACFNLSLPSEDQVVSIIRDEAREWTKKNKGAKVKTDQETIQKLVKNLTGLSYADTKRLVRSAIHNDGALTDADIPQVNRAKYELLDLEGVLHFEYDTEQFSDVGGLENLKRWLGERRESFLHPKENIDPPKGVLLLGVQGGGKSLAAKAVAGLWGVPLLRLDFASLFNKYIGETEKNLREALNMADMMAPCVLWMDEIEKGMASDESQGTSRRVLGTLLTWMAERKSEVFIVATSNDVSELPPELIRKGRMDEIFFVDLPDAVIRKEIFRIHLDKRKQHAADFDLPWLAECSEGFSGAEIEQAVVASLYTAAALSEKLTTEHIVRELNSTSPISVVMAEKIASLRLWADSRTVPAN